MIVAKYKYARDETEANNPNKSTTFPSSRFACQQLLACWCLNVGHDQKCALGSEHTKADGNMRLRLYHALPIEIAFETGFGDSKFHIVDNVVVTVIAF